MKKAIIFLIAILGSLMIAGCYSLPENGDYWKADVYGMVP